jgi:hypothetical protein
VAGDVPSLLPCKCCGQTLKHVDTGSKNMVVIAGVCLPSGIQKLTFVVLTVLLSCVAQRQWQ